MSVDRMTLIDGSHKTTHFGKTLISM